MTRLSGLFIFLLVCATLAVATAGASRSAAQAPSVPPGFTVTTYASAEGPATSLAFGPDTRDPSKTRLYVAAFSSGQILAFDDVGGVGGPAEVFASGFRNPLGVLVDPSGTVFVSDAEAARPGPFGERQYGRVWRVRDTDADGAADSKEIVVRDLPNGRHNTNGLAFGPDGMLYVANGNSTDDGVEGGEPEVEPWSGSVIRVDPRWTDVSLTTLKPRRALVARGMRNLFDVAFSPRDPSRLFIPMNGADDARKNDEPPPDHIEDSDDLLYATDVDDTRRRGGRTRPIIDDFGFPSCLYNLKRRGDLEPYDNPNPDTIEKFGPCPKETVPRPVWSFGLHPSADGLAFQRTDAWGEEFRNDLFVCEFGNFFGDEPAGHKVVQLEFGVAETVVAEHEFLSGGLPLDVTFDVAGNMYVLDFTGVVLKVAKL